MLALVPLALVSASPCSEVVLEADIAGDGRSMHGTVTCTVQEAGPLAVAAYPRLLRTPQHLDDVTRPHFYPHGFSPADMELALEGTPLFGEDVWQPITEARVGERVQVEFFTRVPRRNGTFGAHDQVVYLLGGWHPAFGRVGALEPAPITYRIHVPPEKVGLVGSAPLTRDSDRESRGQMTGVFVPVLLAPAAQVHVADGFVLVAPRAAPSPPPHGLTDLSAPLAQSALAQVESTLADGVHYARRVGLVPAPCVAVLAPLRENLVERFEGGLAISDRAFALLPWERLRKFHRLSLWREQLALAALAPARVREPARAHLVADVVASALLEQLTRERYGRHEYAPDILDPIAVIPEIDALIYAPQVAFATSYYAALDESPRARRRLDNFADTLPRGRLLYDKLTVHRGGTEVLALVAAYLRDARPFGELAGALGIDVEGFWRPFLGPSPQVDYALGDVRVDGAGTHVLIHASGKDAASLKEPITVEVVDGAGQAHRAARLGPGELVLPGVTRMASVEIDPDERLVELAHAPGVAPRFNNRDPKRWRFLLNNIASLIAVTGKEISIAADFSLRRIHDLTYRLDLFALYAPTSAGGAATFSRGFGREVTPLILAQRVGLTGGYERLLSESLGGVPGNLAVGGVFYRYDDRVSPYFSFEGQGLSLRLNAGAGAAESGERFRFFTAGASAFKLWPLGFHHAVLTRVRGDVVTGAAPLQEELVLGDRYRGGRGFERDEASATRRLVFSGEYRHAFATDARTNVMGLVTWTRLEGALFADSVYLPVARTDCDESWFYDVGYGLRFIGDVAGVSPAEIAVDVGVPINRCQDQVGRGPVTVYVAFVQSFAVF